MSSKELEPMLENSGTDDNENYDYVLVFINPFSQSRTDGKFDDSYTKDQIRKIYLALFRITTTIYEDVEESEFLKKIREDVEAYIESLSNEETAYSVVAEELLGKVISVMQEHLKLEISMFLSRDRDEVFVKIRASEENLKVQADLFDYRMQMKANPAHTEDFMEVPPYGPFEKDKEGGSALPVPGLTL
jgi:hypothetical protein